MKTTVNFSQFCDAFRSMGRNENFSYDGKKALFEYLESYEEDCDEDVELDVIALCCEYTEYENLEEFQEAYSSEEYKTIDDIHSATTVIAIDDERFMIANF